MSKKLSITLIIVAFLVGMAGGGLGSSYFWGHFVNKFAAMAEAANANFDIATLNQLQANNVTNAIRLMESRLDDSVGSLGFYVGQIPKAKRDPTQMKIIGKAKEYRDKFPYKSGESIIDESVSNAFSLVETKVGE